MDIKTVVKRDGNRVSFDSEKIQNAVAKAFVSTGEIPAKDVSAISVAIEIIAVNSLKSQKKDNPSVEEIQDEVEKALMTTGYQETAKSYILYRSQQIGRAHV